MIASKAALRKDDGQADFMTKSRGDNISRRNLLRIFAAGAVAAAPTYSNAFGLLRGAGDIRRIKMFSGRLGESIDLIYWVDGEYIPEAFDEISYLMRDWRSGRVKLIDRRTVDIVAASQQMLDTSESFNMLSGYRTPETNRALRNRSRSVARNSLHMSGQAVDLRMQGRSVRQISKAAISCKAGGVGRYSRSNFVHVDCGDVRVWGS